MKTRPSDDANLIREIVQGQSEALAELYDRYRRLTFSVALAIVGDALTAAEVVLDVFVQVWRRAATYRPEQAQVSTWLTAITRHRAIDVLRQQGARPESRSVGWDQAGDQAASGLRDLEESAELSLQRQRVRTALAGRPGFGLFPRLHPPADRQIPRSAARDGQDPPSPGDAEAETGARAGSCFGRQICRTS
jgi:RNA polymerase sigma-70 factor (ECF subfamily)